jgi:CBS domain-containing protein
MHCAAIMNANPLSVRDTQSVAEAAQFLIGHRQLSVPVVDRDGRYMGMFGTEDLLSLMVPRVAIAGNLAPNLRFVDDDPKALSERYRQLKGRPVGEVADKSAIVLAPGTSQIDAFRLFCRNRAPLAVVEPESRKLVGMISYWDVMGVVTSDA